MFTAVSQLVSAACFYGLKHFELSRCFTNKLDFALHVLKSQESFEFTSPSNKQKTNQPDSQQRKHFFASHESGDEQLDVTPGKNVKEDNRK